MATRTEVVLVSDLSGAKADERISFTFDGVSCEIDLTEAEATQMRVTVKKYVEAARKNSAGRRSGLKEPVKVVKAPFTDVSSSAVRAWAGANGFECSRRGRIPTDVIAAYRAAGN